MVFVFGMALGGILLFLGMEIERQRHREKGFKDNINEIFSESEIKFPSTLDGRFFSTTAAIKDISIENKKVGD